MRFTVTFIILAASALSACIGGSKGTATNTIPPPPTANTTTLVVDAGPATGTNLINQAYVTVTVCVPGSTKTCATVDHVLLDTGSWGLRLVGSVLTTNALALTPETDAAGHAVHECLHLGGGDSWGPVALADVSMAGEIAPKVPVQIFDDAGVYAPVPATCGSNGLLRNGVADFNANGVLGVGVFAQDCGSLCVSGAVQPVYYGCTTAAPAGVCTAESVPLSLQVTNPVALFAADNNGVIVDLPPLVNANGDATVQGQLTFGLGTQMDNALPASLTVLGADGNGDFTTSYTDGATMTVYPARPAIIDSGTEAYSFDDPDIAVCLTGNPDFIGYYCPAVAPLTMTAVNTGASGAAVPSVTNTQSFAVLDPANTFVANATAFTGLAGGGGSSNFTWGMPFFYGKKIYVGIAGKAADSYTGPFYAY